MRKPTARHDRLLCLARDIAEDALLTVLRLLYVCGVNRFVHVISTVPPGIIHLFAEARDAAVVHCLEAIQEHEVSDSSIHALPAGARGASLHSLVQHGGGSHFGTYYRIVGPLIARLLIMGEQRRGGQRRTSLARWSKRTGADGRRPYSMRTKPQWTSMSPSRRMICRWRSSSPLGGWSLLYRVIREASPRNSRLQWTPMCSRPDH